MQESRDGKSIRGLRAYEPEDNCPSRAKGRVDSCKHGKETTMKGKFRLALAAGGLGLWLAAASAVAAQPAPVPPQPDAVPSPSPVAECNTLWYSCPAGDPLFNPPTTPPYEVPVGMGG